MVAGLLDTAILVDMLRGYTPAEQWLAQQAQLGITRIVYLEILDGVLNKAEQRRALALLQRFDRIELTTADLEWATQQLIRYRLSHNIGMMDCLIAAPSHRLSLTLFTRNLKHFTPLLGDLAQKPY